MTITKEIKLASVRIVGDDKILEVAEDTVIKEDGVFLSTSRHRKTLHPTTPSGDDTDISAEHADVQALANTAWTDEVKTAWAEKMRLQEEEAEAQRQLAGGYPVP